MDMVYNCLISYLLNFKKNPNINCDFKVFSCKIVHES